ncbi:MAG TPA: hypothetical protein VIM58_07765, partial [Candidatus Methylacidiphilales bacterium]
NESHHIEAQRFLAAPRDPEVVLVGSSMSGRLAAAGLPPSFCNLALDGSNAATGLGIIVASGRKPGIVVAETNALYQPWKPAVVRDALPPFGWLYRTVPPLRLENQPLILFREALAGPSVISPVAGSPVEAPPRDVSYLLRRDGEAGPERWDEAARNLERFIASVEILRARGCRILLVQLPEDPRLSSLPLHRWVQDRLRERLPEDRYAWLRLPGEGPDAYLTGDGVHLQPGSARRAVARIAEDLGRAR